VNWRYGGTWSAGFTRIELVVAIVIIAVVAFLAWPTLKSGLVKRDLTRTMNNGRDLYFAAFRMATDGAAKSESSRAWPGDYPAASLAEYATHLVQNDYLKPADLQRILSGPGAPCTVTMSGPPATVMLSGKSALKIYKVKTADPSNTIFAASTNYVYDTELKAGAIPFGDAGFVVIRKSGDAGVYKKFQATPAAYDNNRARFQAELGALPGATAGEVIPGDGVAVLAGPN
jgi:type II secretory pathway pseudopilin PulG